MDCDLTKTPSQNNEPVVENHSGPLCSESVDPIEDMFNILEGSAIIPFFEQYLKADSFLEICRHTVVGF